MRTNRYLITREYAAEIEKMSDAEVRARMHEHLNNEYAPIPGNYFWFGAQSEWRQYQFNEGICADYCVYVLHKRAGKADEEHAWLWGGDESARHWTYLAQ